ncbi:hypothetical protein FGO68_gene16095 [Halteria grandinella]|uniref:Homologous-pairing protein 2 homolog n=1 Tax=Halteria grandinella TaxID=5974 RepID=A0A8J8NNL4_HALGN|nr:hypothetical protein FGO68_gene16095 [Halteria grandinella]
MTDQEAEKAIAEFMEKQNRPYSVQNMLDHFQQRIKKIQCQRIMDDLTGAQILTCKEYGKAKIYLVNQDLFPTTSNDELLELDEQIKVRKDEFDVLNTDLKQLLAKVKEASQGMTNGEIEAEIASMKKEVTTLNKQLDPFKVGGRKLITQAEIAKAENMLKKAQLEWKKRKRGCMDVVDQVSESVDMNRKEFIKKLGLETDEEYKVVCPL